MKNVIGLNFIILLLIISCIRKKNNDFIREAPNFFQEGNYYYYENNDVKNLLELKKLKNGCDSIEVRLWIDNGLFTPYHLIDFKFENKKWEGKYYYYYYLNRFNNKNIKFTKFEKSIEPKSGWFSFVDLLKQKGLFEFERQNYNKVMKIIEGFYDGVLISMEIATKKYYKFYIFPCPKVIINRLPDANRIIEITNIILEEFNLKESVIPMYKGVPCMDCI